MRKCARCKKPGSPRTLPRSCALLRLRWQQEAACARVHEHLQVQDRFGTPTNLMSSLGACAYAARWPAAMQRRPGQLGPHVRSRRVVAAHVKRKFKSFEDMVTSSDVPVVVDFYATWCGPCQLMGGQILPAVAKLLEADDVPVLVTKVDTERYPQTASRYGVSALPTIVVFKGGREVHRVEGVLPAPRLASEIKQVLS